jgi:hypothetical protein
VFRFAPFVTGGVRLFDLILLVGFALLFVGLIVWIVRRTDGGGHVTPPGLPPIQSWGSPSNPGPPPPSADPALEILRARFARGEIGEDEFVSASRALAQTPR